MPEKSLTDYEKLSGLYRYDPDTGFFYQKKHGRRRPDGVRSKPGDRADKIRKSGYMGVGRFFAHRLAFLLMTGEWPSDFVDHINRDKSDNRWENLRVVSQSENAKNRTINKNNKTGVSGVSIQKDGLYRLTVAGKMIGTYACVSAAKIVKASLK
jgi:hypothetical protein